MRLNDVTVRSLHSRLCSATAHWLIAGSEVPRSVERIQVDVRQMQNSIFRGARSNCRRRSQWRLQRRVSAAILPFKLKSADTR